MLTSGLGVQWTFQHFWNITKCLLRHTRYRVQLSNKSCSRRRNRIHQSYHDKSFAASEINVDATTVVIHHNSQKWKKWKQRLKQSVERQTKGKLNVFFTTNYSHNKDEEDFLSAYSITKGKDKWKRSLGCHRAHRHLECLNLREKINDYVETRSICFLFRCFPKNEMEKCGTVAWNNEKVKKTNFGK